MNTLETANEVVLLVRSLIPLLIRLGQVMRQLGRAAQSYENLGLALTLDLQDSQGEKALVKRVQRVRFHTRDAGILTNPVWGDGETTQAYVSEGANHVGSRREGHRQVLFLSLPDRPRRGTTSSVRTTRTVFGGFTKEQEYFDVVIERPTKHVSLTMLFPQARPPRSARLVAPSGLTRDLSARIGATGRPTLRWRQSNAASGAIYSLRWSW